MLTQQELEMEAYSHGRERMAESIQRAEDNGKADENPYAARLYRDYLFPLRDAIAEDMQPQRGAGRRQAHAALLTGMEYDAVAFLAMRHGIQSAMGDISARICATSIGKAVYNEYLLTQFSEINPKLFYYLMNDIDRRMSSDERYKMNVMRNQAAKNGIHFKEWTPSMVLQVGYYLMQKLVDVELMTVSQIAMKTGGAWQRNVEVQLTDTAQSIVEQIGDYVTMMAPYWTPCVEPPKDWTNNEDGGYHTYEMKSLDPYLVHHRSPEARAAMDTALMDREYQCINALQRTAWRVNRDLLDIVTNVSYHHDMKEVMMQADSPKPQRPAFLLAYEGKVDPAMLPEEQAKAFQIWRREMANWHTDEKLRKVKGYRFDGTMRSARKFVDYPAIYFVYFKDFRGRKYVRANGISPQGSDLQKAMLEFSTGKPLLTKSAQDWFLITGANRFGVDKVSYEDRIAWTEENEHLILDWARNPVDSVGWMKADKPFQFLAWCLEFAKWKALGSRFTSRLSVGQDGSCNGLQNFSAMLLDPVGGRAVNLLPSKLPNDIYQMVADRATSLLRDEPEDEHGFRTLWLDHVLTRGLVKRSVMTLPYGSKRTSCKDFIIKDYLKAGKFPELDAKDYEKAAAFLSYRVWAAIGDVVVKARAAMDWLQQSARRIVKEGNEVVRWITPTGFPVTQCYWTVEEHRINTKLAGNTKIVVKVDTDEANVSKHVNGIAPNFVHSLDASHLTLTTLRCTAAGITHLHMVHDDYGCHAADAGELARFIREEFVGMYQRHDMLQEFKDAYQFLEPAPEQGTLDITQVIDSPYFFG